MVRRVLFVDDEPNVLEGLRRMLRPLRHEWEMAFASGGPEALELLDRAAFDVVVTDMRMPGMDGAQLLAQVRGRHPNLVRIVLTGQSSREAVLRAVRVAHRQLNKPCDSDELRTTIQRACALRDLLADSTLRTLLSRLESVPSPPALYQEVVKELESAEPSMQKVGEIIGRDTGMTAKILHMVHSAFFGVRFHVASPAQAVLFLGAETTKALVLAANIFSKFDAGALKSFAVDAIWAHSQVVGRLAGEVAKSQWCERRVIEEACMAGLLHDTGKLVLAGYLPDRYGQSLLLARGGQVPPAEAERQVFGATHAEVGAYLLGLWGLPDPLVEAVAWHHRPCDCPASTFTPLTAVHVADALVYELRVEDGEETASQLDAAYLARLGLADRLPAWRELRDAAGREGDEP
ncbi:MAG TPA: response regulator [Gemmataceae bacterium]|nr:response regulator [Gemmataceae bacterium]